MREILFRGRRKNGDKRWVKGDLIHGRASYVGIMNRDCLGTSYEVDPETVGQYTGLHAYNGKQVFEHDIVKVYGSLDEISFIGVVKYFDGSFCICDPDFWVHCHLMSQDVEVIGNIYDNPELMGGNK